MHALDLAVLGDDGVPLAPDVAQDGGGVEVDVAERLCELTGRVGEEADSGLLVLVKVLAPGVHDEGVVDANNKDFAGGLRLGRGDVTWDVGLGAAGAWWGWGLLVSGVFLIELFGGGDGGW